MLSQRIARASALRTSLMAGRRLPIVQQRGFLPNTHADPKVLDAKYPEPHSLTEAEDPEMVRTRRRARFDHQAS
jgi:NADH dehydrogenase (ubiquinone) 1 beta subcomplex subunit 8